ncbi:uncharacterized protein LOC126880465 [Diabrotica virgifera virgifera]|uniref:Uncharacterized protein n=1 Tax=Diabrotica virgifera virgifera TaxID=50390 RepID=A0ABM5JQR6_DIAVI|nr:uncharacterized protein LOC126880465 [Diabrotica virgifera virgifera]
MHNPPEIFFLLPMILHKQLQLQKTERENGKEKLNTAMQVYHPHDWMQLIRTSSNKFKVVEMQQADFFDFAALLKGPLIMRKKDCGGNNFKWFDVKWLSYGRDFGSINYKTSLRQNEPFKTISFKRTTRQTRHFILQPITDQQLAISKEKKRDLISLLPLIPEYFHHFYENLKIAADVRDVDPDLDRDESDL